MGKENAVNEPEYDVVVCDNSACECPTEVLLRAPLPYVFKSHRNVKLAGTCPVCHALYVMYEDEEIACDA